MQYAVDLRSSAWLGCPVGPVPCYYSRIGSDSLLWRKSSSSKRSSPAIKLEKTAVRVVSAVMAETGMLEEPVIAERIGSGPQEGLFPVSNKRVVLVRHGQSTWNESGRIQGSSDFSRLTTKGETQAETSRQMLLSDSFDVCFHSPLSRAKRTAEIIWSSRKKEAMVSMDDLREIDLYSFQGLFKDEGKAQFGDAYKMWQKDASNFVIDDHYPVRELWERAGNCWNTILSSTKGSSVLVVAHNAVNQALVATATGLGPEYFRHLLQSNCGVSVLDFTPRIGKEGPPYVCLDRLNQTPAPPLQSLKKGTQILLVCHGATDSSFRKTFSISDTEPMNMLGIIQSGKTAELLLDVSVDSLISSPQPCALATSTAIVQVQEAADCLGGDCVPRYVEVTEMPELRDLNWGSWHGMPKQEVTVDGGRWQDYLMQNSIVGGESVEEFWQRAGQAWKSLLEHVHNLEASEDGGGDGSGKTVVVVGHEILHIAILCHCLGLDQSYLPTFHLDTSSLSVIDLPDGAFGRTVVRCLNYTAHLGRWAVPVTRPSSDDEEF
ncbi:unnamed protein product [Calypogeia fissa]